MKTYAEKYCVRNTGKLYIGAFYRKPFEKEHKKRHYNYKLEGFYKGYCFLWATGCGRNWREKIHVSLLCLSVSKSKRKMSAEKAIKNGDEICVEAYLPAPSSGSRLDN